MSMDNNLLAFVDMMKKKAPEYINLVTAQSDADFEKAFDVVLENAVYRLEQNKTNFGSLNEVDCPRFSPCSRNAGPVSYPRAAFQRPCRPHHRSAALFPGQTKARRSKDLTMDVADQEPRPSSRRVTHSSCSRPFEMIDRSIVRSLLRRAFVWRETVLRLSMMRSTWPLECGSWITDRPGISRARARTADIPLVQAAKVRFCFAPTDTTAFSSTRQKLFRIGI